MGSPWFIWKGRVSGLADVLRHAPTLEERKEMEFTGIKLGRWVGLGFLHLVPAKNHSRSGIEQ